MDTSKATISSLNIGLERAETTASLRLPPSWWHCLQGRACGPHAITLGASTATSVPIAKNCGFAGVSTRSKCFAGEACFARIGRQRRRGEVVFVRAGIRPSNSQPRSRSASCAVSAWIAGSTTPNDCAAKSRLGSGGENAARCRIKWMFTTDKARTKMGRAYPAISKESQSLCRATRSDIHICLNISAHRQL